MTEKTSMSEVNRFNSEWEEFEMWKKGILEKIPKDKSYNYEHDAPKNPPWWHQNLQKAWLARKAKCALRQAVTTSNQTQLPDAKEVLADTNLWENYCKERESKRKPGRPKLSSEQRKQNTKVKYADKMKSLLESQGYAIKDGFVYDNRGKRWIFLPNGKVEMPSGDRISTYHFIKKYGTL